MQYDLTSLMPVMPEIFLLCAASVVLVVDLFLSERTRQAQAGGKLCLDEYTAAVEVALEFCDQRIGIHLATADA